MGSVILSNVSKVYPGGVRAVEDVSLTIPEGCFAALVGPSGCGKSTVLRMIAGLEDVTQGSVSIAGRVVNDIEPKDRDIAMVFQSYALYPHMTVEKNLGFALSMRGIPKPEITRRVHDVARALGIEELLQRRPGELSGGQRQRVAVGRAIVREPKVFLFDEPLSNLDAKLRVSTRAELKALHARLRTTTVFVTHDQEEAMTLGQLVVVMSRGKVQQAGTPQEVYDAPANRFVAGFVGTPPMNFIDAALQPAPAHDAVLARLPAGNHLSLHPGQSRALRDKASSACVLGIRPGALRLCPPDQALFAGSVTLADFLGDFVDVHLRTDAGLAILARVDVSQAQSAGLLGTGQAPTLRVGLTAPAERFHVFAPGPEGQRWA